MSQSKHFALPLPIQSKPERKKLIAYFIPTENIHGMRSESFMNTSERVCLKEPYVTNVYAALYFRMTNKIHARLQLHEFW